MLKPFIFVCVCVCLAWGIKIIFLSSERLSSITITFVPQTFKKLTDIFSYEFIFQHTGINPVIMLEIYLKPCSDDSLNNIKSLANLGSFSLSPNIRAGEDAWFLPSAWGPTCAQHMGLADLRHGRTCWAQCAVTAETEAASVGGANHPRGHCGLAPRCPWDAPAVRRLRP